MPAFRQAIKERRCVVPVDYFVEGSAVKKLAEPYKIFQKDQDAFLLAGIWDEWVDKETGEVIRTYSILTTAASSLLIKIGHHRSPLVLTHEQTDIWLDKNADRSSLEQIMHPFDSSIFDAHRISPEIKKKQNNQRLFDPQPEELKLDL
jgi:putative SOS response-associated peptidase YedK